MLPSFHILGSGSSGNAAILDTGEERILIDCGLSGRQIARSAEACGIPVGTLQAACLTHEHQDHSRGIRGLRKQGQIEWITSARTASVLQTKFDFPVRWACFEPGSTLRLGTLEIATLRIPHDAVDPVAYTFTWGGDSLFAPQHKLGWILDLGYFPESLGTALADCDTLVIEANHDEGMLERDPRRPWSLKQRVRSRHGHLSNREAFEALDAIPDPQWKNLCLVHLSRDCNDPAIVKDTFAPLRDKRPALRIHVIPPDLPDPTPLPLGS